MGGAARARCRSFCFLERAGTRWTVFLITYLRPNGQWRGYFSYRPATDEFDGAEIRTADLFVEESEQDVDTRARGLGRPLVHALLESSLETHEKRRGFSPNWQRWFRDLLSRHAEEGTRVPADAASSAAALRAIYDAYRRDQVAHLIALIEPDDFREIVELLLEGRRIDFRADDRFQLAMGVVQELERKLSLPPFDTWIEDYLSNAEEYRRYARTLHGGDGILP